jgi:hypothetical protein
MCYGPTVRPGATPDHSMITAPVVPVVPDGYVAWSGQSALKSPFGLSQLMIALLWVTTAATALLSGAYYSRVRTWQDLYVIPGMDRLNLADTLVQAAAFLQITTLLAAMIVSGLWSKRIATNAAALGHPGVNPAWVAIGWFVPLAGLWLGFRTLRITAKRVGLGTKALWWWNALLVAFVVAVCYLLRDLGDATVDLHSTMEDLAILSMFRIQVIICLVATGLCLAATLVASKAARRLNDLLSCEGLK